MKEVREVLRNSKGCKIHAIIKSGLVSEDLVLRMIENSIYWIFIRLNSHNEVLIVMNV